MPCLFKKMDWQSLLHGKINLNIAVGAIQRDGLTRLMVRLRLPAWPAYAPGEGVSRWPRRDDSLSQLICGAIGGTRELFIEPSSGGGEGDNDRYELTLGLGQSWNMVKFFETKASSKVCLAAIFVYTYQSTKLSWQLHFFLFLLAFMFPFFSEKCAFLFAMCVHSCQSAVLPSVFCLCPL